MRPERECRLYNILFPVWLFFLWPTLAWLVIIPADFAVDALVLFLALRHFRCENAKNVWLRGILKVWLIGFAADMAGAALIFGITWLAGVIWPEANLLLFPGTCLVSLPGVMLAAVLIYLLDRRFAFRNSGLEAATAGRICLALAVFTAPYTMLIPIYG